MPRTGRKVSCTGFYHVMVRGINREKVFNQKREKVYFKRTIYKYLAKYEIHIYAYCIMSTHAHFLIRAEIHVLSAFMSAVLSEYASYYNFKHNRNGHVFQNRFCSECIEDEAYYWNCIRYIHMNPVKANVVKNPLRYQYGSMSEYLSATAQMLHADALEKFRSSFQDYHEFEKFHFREETQVFLDIQEEMERQREEAAIYFAKIFFQEKHLENLIQVFEEKKNRDEYIIKLMKILKISRRKADKLCMKTYEKCRMGGGTE